MKYYCYQVYYINYSISISYQYGLHELVMRGHNYDKLKMFSSVHSTMKNGKKISKNAIKYSVFNDFQSRIFSHFIIANNQYNYLLVFRNKSKLQKNFILLKYVQMQLQTNNLTFHIDNHDLQVGISIQFRFRYSNPFPQGKIELWHSEIQ